MIADAYAAMYPISLAVPGLLSAMVVWSFWAIDRRETVYRLSFYGDTLVVETWEDFGPREQV